MEISRVFFPPNFDDILYNNRARDSARQRGHSARTARHIYAVEADHLAELSSDALLGFGKISELWWGVAGTGSDKSLVPFRVLQETERHQVSELKNEVAELRTEVAGLKGQIDSLDGKVARMSGTMDKMNQSLHTILGVVRLQTVD